MLEHLVDEADREEGHLRPYRLRHLDQVLLVVGREDHRLDSRPVGGHHLLFESPDRDDLPAQGHFPGHRDVVSNRSLGERGGDRHDDRDAGGGAVLGNRALREVDVHVVVVELLRIDAEHLGPGPHVAVRGLDRLLHDVPELPRHDHAPGAAHLERLDQEQVAPSRRPGEPGRDADLGLPLRSVGEHVRRSQNLLDVRFDEAPVPREARGPLPGGLAAEVIDRALQLADARLARVLADDLREGGVVERDVGRRQPVLLRLPRNQVPPGDLELLLVHVAGDLDHLEAV